MVKKKLLTGVLPQRWDDLHTDRLIICLVEKEPSLQEMKKLKNYKKVYSIVVREKIKNREYHPRRF